MAIDAAHRASIFEKLRPILGDEDANVLMSEFPSVEAQELVTKDFLRAELVITRQDLRSEMAALGTDLRSEMAAQARDLRSEIATVRGDVADLRLGLAALEGRLTLRLGAAIAASTALLGTIGLFH